VPYIRDERPFNVRLDEMMREKRITAVQLAGRMTDLLPEGVAVRQESVERWQSGKVVAPRGIEVIAALVIALDVEADRVLGLRWVDEEPRTV
jgi:hypothetical protein